MNNPSTTTRTPEDTVKAFIRAFNEHDLDAALAYLSPEFVAIGVSTQGKPMSKEAYAKIYATFGQAFPDFKWELTSIVSTGNTVAFEGFESATFKAPYDLPGHTIAPTNRSYRTPVAVFFHVNAHGLIAQAEIYANPAEANQQLGIDPQHFTVSPSDWEAKATTH